MRIRKIDGSLAGSGRSTAERATFCARCDLDLLFDPKDWRTGMSAVYLCHQRIYANHNAGKGFRRRFAGDQPMRLVFFDRIPQEFATLRPMVGRCPRCLRDQKTFGVRRES